MVPGQNCSNTTIGFCLTDIFFLEILQVQSRLSVKNLWGQLQQSCLRAGCSFCCPTNSVKALKGKVSYSTDLLTQSLLGALPTLSLSTTGSWSPYVRVAKPLVSLLIKGDFSNNLKIVRHS